MDTVLVDTSVASFFLPSKNRPERAAYTPFLEGRRWALSFQSVGELWGLAVRNGWSDRRTVQLHDFLRQFAVVPADFELARCWAEVVVRSERIGRRLETADAWILATARRHDLPLVTHDADLLVGEELGVRVITTLRRS